MSSPVLVETKMANIERNLILAGYLKLLLSLFSVFPSFEYLNQSLFVLKKSAQALKPEFLAINMFTTLLYKLSI